MTVNDDIDDPTGDDPEGPAETALVEVSPGAALVFGRVPEGLDLVPFRLLSSEDQAAIGAAVAGASSVLNVGGQLASGLAQTQGLVRLAPQTLAALKAGATPIQSGAYNIGVLAGQNSKFVAQVRWLPAGGTQAASMAANLGPALAMLAIQVQLNEIAGLVHENIALTETVLRTVRHEQWAELTGLEQAVTRALNEASSVGEVTQLLWENIAGYEAPIRKQRDLFRRNIEAHSSELAKQQGHQERRQYMEKNGEAILLDLHSLLLAHKSWFEYQALRAGRAKLCAGDDPSEAKLLEAIIENAQSEYEHVVEQMTTVLDTLNRELSILAELPGKRTIPFTGARRSAEDLKNMSQQLLGVVSKLSNSVRTPTPELGHPDTIHVDEFDRLDQDLRILRWHLDGEEHLDAIATARELGRGSTLNSLPGVRDVGSNEVLIAVTGQRVVVADLSEFRNQGVILRSVANDEIRYVRFRNDGGTGEAEIDLITKYDNLAWRFSDGSGSAGSVKSLSALLADRMEIPEVERDAAFSSHCLLTPFESSGAESVDRPALIQGKATGPSGFVGPPALPDCAGALPLRAVIDEAVNSEQSIAWRRSRKKRTLEHGGSGVASQFFLDADKSDQLPPFAPRIVQLANQPIDARGLPMDRPARASSRSSLPRSAPSSALARSVSMS